MKEARCQNVKMKAEERHWNMCTDTERQQCKRTKIARARLYEGDRVVGREWGTERKDGEDIRCEDVTQTLLHTDAFTYKRSFAEPFLHIDAFTYTDAFTHRSFFHTHTRLYAQTLLHTDTFYAHTHTHLLRRLIELWCGMQRSCKNTNNQKTQWDDPRYIYMGV